MRGSVYKRGTTWDMRRCSRYQDWACWGASQAGFEGPELTPDGGCTIQPSSAVAVVESIRVSVGRAESHHPVLSVTLRTLGSSPSGFFLLYRASSDPPDRLSCIPSLSAPYSLLLQEPSQSWESTSVMTVSLWSFPHLQLITSH